MLGQNPQGYLRAITSFTRNERPSSQSHPIKSGQNLNERVAKCTICREKEYLKNLCAPCECEGTKGFVHFTCVKAWAEASDSNRCPDCGHRLKLRIERTRTSFQRFMHRSDFGRLVCKLPIIFFALLYISFLSQFHSQLIYDQKLYQWAEMLTVLNILFLSAIVIVLIVYMIVLYLMYTMWKNIAYRMEVLSK
ncbi:E3 ubiquitin-protein ligase MARCH3 [Sarcoptes scabiei]|uniref:E3 ubiquitin-protein ligase MARCH3 n=1 Tax=Sarcoptes scabiei TaxID=52283 RepID=A0A834RA08_SARSC|nr:E3 ubiquitin-protein ligase MARCH3 [Sarcoptes scabiei]UXI18971.1 hypothetical protein NH340_JMT04914 [Sarcoptes scabiei]